MDAYLDTVASTTETHHKGVMLDATSQAILDVLVSHLDIVQPGRPETYLGYKQFHEILALPQLGPWGETVRRRKACGSHHVQPLGSPHNGPDVMGNLVCVCPNHHAQLDFGAIRIDGKKLRTVDCHVVAAEFITYHNTTVFASPSHFRVRWREVDAQQFCHFLELLRVDFIQEIREQLILPWLPEH
jgi:hypothetical protein